MGDGYAAEREIDKKKQQDFLAYVAHELRTPLNGMIGLAYSLIETEANKGRQKHLKMIQSSAQRLVGIVNSIMDITALRDGKMELKPVDNCDLKEICEEVYQLMLIAVDKNNKKIKKDTVDLQLEVDPSSPVIQGDKERITQIIFNLTNNALKFTPGGFVKISLKNETSSVLACVSDSGQGIKPENLKKIFEPFGQEEEGKGGGLGLGLSIVTKIADLHGGDVWVESVLGKGAAFFVRLPLKMNPKLPNDTTTTPTTTASTTTVPTTTTTSTAPTGAPAAAGPVAQGGSGAAGAGAPAFTSAFQSGGSNTSSARPRGGRRGRGLASNFRSRDALASGAPDAIAEEGGAAAPGGEAVQEDFGDTSHLVEARRVAKDKTVDIVLVESEESEGTAFQAILDGDKIKNKVKWFRDAYSALDHLENVAILPDVVFAAVDLPGFNGFQLCEELRQFCPPELPVILTVSAQAHGTGVRAEAASRLATDVVHKDAWDKKEVAALVRAAAVKAELEKLALRDRINDEVFKLLVPERRRLGGPAIVGAAGGNVEGGPLPGQIKGTIMIAKIKEIEVIRSILSTSQYRTLLSKIQHVFDAKLLGNDCFKVESRSDEFLVASDAPECVERILEFAKQCIIELKEIKVANKNVEFFIGVHLGYLDGIFLSSVNGTLPRFLVTGEPVNWAHMLQLTGFPNHVHLSEEVFVEIEKEFSGSGIYDCYPRGTLRGRKTYVMRNTSSEDPGQFTHASLDFFLMHALNFREGAEEVIQQLERDVKNLQLRVDLMRGGSHRDAAMKLLEQDLLKQKLVSPAALLAVISDPVDQILAAVDSVVASLPAGGGQPPADQPLIGNLDTVISDFELMLANADMSSASLRETRKAARQVAATTRLPDSTALVVTGEAASVLGGLLDDLMDTVGDKMRRVVEAEVAANANVEIQRRFETIVTPLQQQVDFLAAEIDDIQHVMKGVADNYALFKVAMPPLLLNLNKTNSALVRSLGTVDGQGISAGEAGLLSAQVKQLQLELLRLRGEGRGRPAGADVEKLKREVELVRRELEDAVNFRHKLETILDVTQAELNETKLSLKLHQQLVTASRSPSTKHTN